MTAPVAPPATTEASQLTKETYRGRIHPDWCPGCGDFSVLVALQRALFELELQPHQACVISGIGCPSNLPGYINTYGMHTLHGRALAVATRAQLANHKLTIIVTGGDGDGFGIGGNHTPLVTPRAPPLARAAPSNPSVALPPPPPTPSR